MAALGVGDGVQGDTGTHLLSPVFCLIVAGVFGGDGDSDPHGDGGEVVDRHGRKHDGVQADPTFFNAAPTRAPTTWMIRAVLHAGRVARPDERDENLKHWKGMIC